MDKKERILGYQQKSPAYLLDETGYDVIAWYKGVNIAFVEIGIPIREVFALSIFLINRHTSLSVDHIKDHYKKGSSSGQAYDIVRDLTRRGFVEKAVRRGKAAAHYFITKEGVDVMRRLTDIFYEEKMKLS